MLAACTSTDESPNKDVGTGIIKVAVTYPGNFVDYGLVVTTTVVVYDLTKIGIEGLQFDYLNDPNFVAADDPDNIPLVPGSTTHVFQTSTHAGSLAMQVNSYTTDVDVEEEANVNLKIFLNNTLKDEVDLITERGGFDFIWTPDEFLYEAF